MKKIFKQIISKRFFLIILLTSLLIGCMDCGYDSNWKQVGGNGINKSWDASSSIFEEVRVLVVYKNMLYAGLLTSAEYMQAEIWRFDGNAWEICGGNGLNNSWSKGAYMSVNALTADNNYLYAGTGIHQGMATVWRFDGSSWLKIGGDGINNSWGSDIDGVWHLSIHQGELYAGLVGEDNGILRAPLYKYDGINWQLVTGINNENAGWGQNQGYMMCYISTSDGANLYVGLAGRDTNTADVYLYNGSTFAQIGGDGLNNSWSNPDAMFIEDAIMYNDDLYISMNGIYTSGIKDFPVWKWNGAAWNTVADVPEEWENPDYSIFNKLFVFQNKLYLGVGGKMGTASMWECVDNRWVRISNNEFNKHILKNKQTLWIYTICDFQNEMYIGLASAETAGMAQVWKYIK